MLSHGCSSRHEGRSMLLREALGPSHLVQLPPALWHVSANIKHTAQNQRTPPARRVADTSSQQNSNLSSIPRSEAGVSTSNRFSPNEADIIISSSPCISQAALTRPNDSRAMQPQDISVINTALRSRICVPWVCPSACLQRKLAIAVACADVDCDEVDFAVQFDAAILPAALQSSNEIPTQACSVAVHLSIEFIVVTLFEAILYSSRNRDGRLDSSERPPHHGPVAIHRNRTTHLRILESSA
ncbi:hypothetical protein BKA62DRAFT_313933 [Auriculariales sp. MPI-PUGE-AT-0066]|nr:hypothetical protein BKA62DRAFT_313933 [Auriculariales sp. MPI-PUGE-AT-0066]